MGGKEKKYHILDPSVGENVGSTSDFTTVVRNILAKSDSGMTLYFMPGEYHFWPDNADTRELFISNTDSAEYPRKQVGILLESKKDFSFIGKGASLIFHGALTAIALIECKDILFSGLEIDYACPSTVDLTITEVNEADGKTSVIAEYPDSYECRIDRRFRLFEKTAQTIESRLLDDGSVIWSGEKSPYTGEKYWSECASGMLSQRFEAKTGLVYRTDDDLFSSSELVSIAESGRLKINYNRFRDISVGDCFQMRNTKRDGCGIFIDRCEDVRFEDMRIGYLYAMGVVSQCSENLSFEGIRFRTHKKGTMSSSSADMLHFSHCRGKIRICRCDFHNPHDDPINVHGVFLQVESFDGKQAVLRFSHPQTFGFPCVFSNDYIQFYDSASLLPIEAPYRVMSVDGPSATDRYRITVILDRDLVLPCDRVCAAENRSWLPDVLITENRFEQIPTRGLLVSTGGSVIVKNNFFTRIYMSGILISGDANNWFESGPVQDATIENNIFNDCAQAAVLIEPNNYELSDRKVHRNISITGNIISMDRRHAISVKSSGNITVRSNIINIIGDATDYIENIDSDIASYDNTLCQKAELR